MAKLNIVGMDPSLRNWGLAFGNYDTESHKLHINKVDIVQTFSDKAKQLRQNSHDLSAAEMLYAGVSQYILAGAHAVFVEVPVGSQSARSMASYGVCLGVLGCLRGLGVPLYELTPTEVKMASAGSKTASKADMIEWATTNHPNLNWPTTIKKGVSSINASIAEHEADAIAAIYAGIVSPQFKQAIKFYNGTN